VGRAEGRWADYPDDWCPYDASHWPELKALTKRGWFPLFFYWILCMFRHLFLYVAEEVSPRSVLDTRHQRKGIVPFAKGLDVIQQAQSGTGKTATFCADILQNVDHNVADCQALVLARTRALALQIEKVMRALGDDLAVQCHACVGGTSVREDERILRSGVHVVVGTPGRVYDMLRRRALRADAIKMFVLDEADEMLSGGFKDQIYDIIQILPPKLQQQQQQQQQQQEEEEAWTLVSRRKKKKKSKVNRNY
jgi:superfamily II DNA/RNA helicase